MTDEDDEYLKSINAKQSASTQCSEDQLEEVMNFFEETSQIKQPYAAVDNPPIVSWEEMENALDETYDDEIRSFASTIYEHWKARRLKVGNKSLIPNLKVSSLLVLEPPPLTRKSSKLGQIPTMEIHMSVSEDEK